MRVYVRGTDPEVDDAVLENVGSFELVEMNPYPAKFAAEVNADISGLSPGNYTIYVGKLNGDYDVEGVKFELDVQGVYLD